MVCHPLYGHTSLPPLSRAQHSHKLHLFSLQTTAQLSKCNPRPLHPDPHSAATTPAAVPSHFRLMGRQGKSYTRYCTFHTENLLPYQNCIWVYSPWNSLATSKLWPHKPLRAVTNGARLSIFVQCYHKLIFAHREVVNLERSRYSI